MKSRLIALENFPATAPGFLFVRRLADNSSDENFNGPYTFNTRFNPSMAIIIVVLLSAFFFMGFFSIYIRRCSTGGGDASRASRRAGARASNNGEGHNREATRGLDKTVIESFPVFSYSLVKELKSQDDRPKSTDCAVCLNDFVDDEMLRLLPKCSHAFHPECVDMWLCSHTTCPVCRMDLLPADESNPTGTEFGVVEPQVQTPPEEVAIVVDNGGGVVSRHASVRSGRVHDESMATNGAATEAGDESGLNAGEKIRRSHSTGHSLVRLRKDLEKPTEWYIATPGGLTPGLHRSCSFMAMHHSRSQGASTSKAGALAGCTKSGDSASRRQGSCIGDPPGGSERWGGISSMNPVSILRSFSERPAPQNRDQRPAALPQQDRRASLKKTLNWLTGRDREGSSSSKYADHGGPSPL